MPSNSNSPDSLALPTLPFLQPLRAERFPTFQELAEQEREAMGKPASLPKKPSLFEALLGNPAILHAALLDKPDNYDPKLLPLLLQLRAGRELSSLTPEEIALLNAATLEFAQFKPPQKAKAPAPQGLAPTKSSEPDDADTADGDERDLEWNGGRGERFNRPPPPATQVNEQALAMPPNKWWERGLSTRKG